MDASVYSLPELQGDLLACFVFVLYRVSLCVFVFTPHPILYPFLPLHTFNLLFQ